MRTGIARIGRPDASSQLIPMRGRAGPVEQRDAIDRSVHVGAQQLRVAKPTGRTAALVLETCRDDDLRAGRVSRDLRTVYGGAPMENKLFGPTPSHSLRSRAKAKKSAAPADELADTRRSQARAGAGPRRRRRRALGRQTAYDRLGENERLPPATY